MAPFSNEYKLRKVANSNQKSCVVCYKPTPDVLITSNNLDFFYVCLSHLKDENFAVPMQNENFSQLTKLRDDLISLITKLSNDIEKKKPSAFSNLPGFKKDDKDKEVYDNLIKEKQLHDKKLDDIKRSISEFQFKEYSLNDDIFKIRIKSYINKINAEKRAKEISNSNFFPTAPKNIPGSMD